MLQIGTIGIDGTIVGIQSGDSIVLTGVTDATDANIVSGNTLQILRSGNPEIDLKLDPAFRLQRRLFPPGRGRRRTRR